MKNIIKFNKINPGTIEWIKSISIAIIIALLINIFLFRATRVKGISMNPTLKEKDRILSIKVSLLFKDPSYGDIIVLKIPNEENKQYIKRIIGVQGDKIEILNGKLYLNDKLLKENYIENNIQTYTKDKNLWIVPKDQLFVLGDNRQLNASFDSRHFDTIPLDSVRGIANFRYFPLDKSFGKINKTP